MSAPDTAALEAGARASAPALSIEVFASRELAYEAAADAILEGCRLDLSARGWASFAAAGGATPGPVYERLASRQFDWSRVAVTLTDERWVPPNDPASNAGMIGRTLMSAQTRHARFFPLWAAGPSPRSVAFAAGDAISPLCPFDSVLLGMGEDGHVASLFPDDEGLEPALDPRGRALVIAVDARRDGPPQPRLSLTLAAMARARRSVLLAIGRAKLDTLVRASRDHLPVARVCGALGARILWAA